MNIIKSKPKIAIVMPSKDGFSEEYQKMFDAIEYPKDKLDVFVEKSPGEYDKDYDNVYINHIQNCASVRNKARMKALLESDAEYFFYTDDDVYCPPNVLEELLWMKQPVCAGWVPSKFTNKRRWIAGYKKLDHTGIIVMPEHPFIEPQQTTPFMSVMTPVDCSLWRREITAMVRFRGDYGKRYFVENQNEHSIVFTDECQAAGDDLLQLGILCAMSTRIVCDHERK